METQKRTVTIEEQERMGIRRTSNYTPARPVESTAITRAPKAEVIPQTPVVMEITPHATSHVEMKTSARDRAEGFLLQSIPNTLVFAIAVAAIVYVATEITASAAIVTMFAVFAATQFSIYIFTLLISAEGISFFEAWQKWLVIKREQQERWRHYRGG